MMFSIPGCVLFNREKCLASGIGGSCFTRVISELHSFVAIQILKRDMLDHAVIFDSELPNTFFLQNAFFCS